MPSRPSRGGRAQASSCPCPCCCFCSPVSSAASRAQLPPLPSAPPTPPELRDVEKRLDVLTNDIATTISDRFSFCIADVEADWNEAFNYTSDLGFVDRCILETQVNACGGRNTAAKGRCRAGVMIDEPVVHMLHACRVG